MGNSTSRRPPPRSIGLLIGALVLVALSSCGGGPGDADPGRTGTLTLTMMGWDKANGNKVVTFDPDPRTSKVVTCADDVCNYTTFPPGGYTVEVAQGQITASHQFTIRAGETTEAEIRPPATGAPRSDEGGNVQRSPAPVR